MTTFEKMKGWLIAYYAEENVWGQTTEEKMQSKMDALETMNVMDIKQLYYRVKRQPTCKLAINTVLLDKQSSYPVESVYPEQAELFYNQLTCIREKTELNSLQLFVKAFGPKQKTGTRFRRKSIWTFTNDNGETVLCAFVNLKQGAALDFLGQRPVEPTQNAKLLIKTVLSVLAHLG